MGTLFMGGLEIPAPTYLQGTLIFTPDTPKTTVVALGMVLPAQQGRLIPEEIPVFPAGRHSLKVMVASDTNPCAEV